MKDGANPSYYHSDPDHKYQNGITSFANHPSFALPKTDPGQIKFNHVKHLTAGQEIDWTLANIKKDDPLAYERYKNAAPQSVALEARLSKGEKNLEDQAPVVLDCASCHVLDPGDIPGGKGTKAAGAYYQPISFDTNCKACHALTFDAAMTRTVKGPDGKDVVVYQQAPHGIQPADVNPFLWGVYANAYLKDPLKKEFAEALEAAVKGLHQPSRPLPGKPAIAAAQDDISKRVEQARQTLVLGIAAQKQEIVRYGNCSKCHHFEERGGVGGVGFGANARPQRVMPSNIPVVWQTHAKFDHVSHRAMDCKSCHEQVDKAVTKDAVMLPNIKNCRECHVPVGTDDKGQRIGGVRHDCTGCHSYHNGDHADRGLGAIARNPKTLLNGQDLLNGRKKQ
jgi:hypothetical protein